MKHLIALACCCLLVGSCGPPSFSSQPGAGSPDDSPSPTPLTTTRVASGLSRPVFVTAPPDDFERLFILEQHTGRIRILNLASGQINSAAFLTINNLATGEEQGLLGLAFDPNYTENGRFYVNFTRSVGLFAAETRIARGTVSDDPDVADGTLEVILSYSQPFPRHNGGWLGFGPDGFLYIGTGDGGSANDPGNRAQDTTNQRLGKILRIDVSPAEGYVIPPDNPFVGRDGDDEIWAYGIRNAWRCSFDRETGDLYIGDVGQSGREEIDFQAAASVGGRNYGWPCREGSTCLGSRAGCSCDDSTLASPIYEYTHASGCSVTGGYVYRGCAIPSLRGAYFFADYCSNDVLSMRHDGTSVTELIDRTQELAPSDSPAAKSISSFGEDGRGELYICDLSDGEIFKIVPATVGESDECEP